MTTLLIILACAVSPILSALAVIYVQKRLRAQGSKPPPKAAGEDVKRD